MSKEEEALNRVEGTLKSLKDELEVCKEAKTTGEVCDALVEHSEKEPEPFSTIVDGEPNPWHSNPSGGGCVIL
eukprot:CAMPEP_0194378186 /NCGR_PEP_ID=MMETSP0174-20130528/34427_1 /TAXON_ID=216777 /ORGANISM="Proboscia alata, Strain PI-D3" /LENGTH=72 /DNA_ID=CAMNT_0039160021 /DNA_START=116 /DNA_END=337 /DNA_ORIENTATION=-